MMIASQFQSFDHPAGRLDAAPRLARLRQELVRRQLDGFIIPRADEHQGENVPDNAQRLPWLTGFTGSAGVAAVLTDTAAIFVDGRYTLQMRAQVDTALFTPHDFTPEALALWIEANLPKGAKLGFDPWLHTADDVARLDQAVKLAGGQLEATDGSPLDAVWSDRPAPPKAPVWPHPLKFAGEERAQKLHRVRQALQSARIDTLIVSDPTNLAWLFNVRGGDVAHIPVALGYALVPAEGRPSLFLDPTKFTADARDALAPVADLAEPTELLPALRRIATGASRVRIDAATGGYALKQLVEASGGIADVGPDPITLIKAVKNSVERDGARAAHHRDGVAMARFLAWFDGATAGGALTEIDAAEQLEHFRRQTNALAEISFPTISAAGPHAALPHYRVSRTSNRPIEPGIFLIDSGGQYQDGTTDITRTIAVGIPSDEMRDRYTRVLKGHIAIATAVFPEGTSGSQLDAFSRQFLWQEGMDFDHGTGHGVGAFLSVHEGPHRLSKLGTTPLKAGMILSNEPGYYYKEAAYGIRIENLILVEARHLRGAERPMLGFETLTLAPIDLRLIEPGLMTAPEIAWLNAYHDRVRDSLAPHLDPITIDWLEQATAPLKRAI